MSVQSIHMWDRSKAVAVGAISHYLSVSRVVEYTYGTLSTIEYDHSDPEHRNRSHKKYLGITGEFHLDIFGPILFKVVVFVFRLNARNRSNLLGDTGTRYAGVSREDSWH